MNKKLIQKKSALNLDHTHTTHVSADRAAVFSFELFFKQNCAKTRLMITRAAHKIFFKLAEEIEGNNSQLKVCVKLEQDFYTNKNGLRIFLANQDLCGEYKT